MDYEALALSKVLHGFTATIKNQAPCPFLWWQGGFWKGRKSKTILRGLLAARNGCLERF